ncbi:MAG: OprD family outer membrane porin [Campylobacterota bacterium]|nr:OprD family outer membrane porin [Campylobacterota bacterium]
MKKYIALSAISLGLISSVNIQASDNVSKMFSEGEVSGQIRAFYINRDDNTKADNQIGTAIGGHLKFETAELNGLSLGTAFYTTNRIARGMEADVMGPNTTLFRNDGSSYSLLGEAYLQYKYENTVFKAGRQKLATPLAGADDARMLPNLFEAYLVINKDVSNTTLIVGHVTKFAAGSFANAYNGGIVGATAGYSAVVGNTAKYQGEFTNMGTWAVGQKTDGVSVVSASYKKDNLKAQVWDYYAHDILNAIYADASISWKCLVSDKVKPTASIQVIKEDSVGDEYAGNIDSLYWGAKVGAKAGALSGYVAYSQQSSATATTQLENSTITPWGGMPAYTQGMVTRHMLLSGVKATKVLTSYNFKDMGANLSATAYYASFDMDNYSGYGTSRTAKESGFDIKYYPQSVENLQLRIRGNFPNDFGNGRDWNEYRFIANYTF